MSAETYFLPQAFAAPQLVAVSFLDPTSWVSVPVWLLFALSAIAVTAIGLAAWVVSKTHRNRSVVIHSPTTAEIFGIRWRWSNAEGDIQDVTSYCPKCNLEVAATAETRHGVIRLISYKCPCGKWRSQSFHCSKVTFIERVCGLIQQEVEK